MQVMRQSCTTLVSRLNQFDKDASIGRAGIGGSGLLMAMIHVLVKSMQVSRGEEESMMTAARMWVLLLPSTLEVGLTNDRDADYNVRSRECRGSPAQLRCAAAGDGSCSVKLSRLVRSDPRALTPKSRRLRVSRDRDFSFKLYARQFSVVQVRNREEIVCRPTR